ERASIRRHLNRGAVQSFHSIARARLTIALAATPAAFLQNVAALQFPAIGAIPEQCCADLEPSALLAVSAAAAGRAGACGRAFRATHPGLARRGLPTRRP